MIDPIYKLLHASGRFWRIQLKPGCFASRRSNVLNCPARCSTGDIRRIELLSQSRQLYICIRVNNATQPQWRYAKPNRVNLVEQCGFKGDFARINTYPRREAKSLKLDLISSQCQFIAGPAIDKVKCKPLQSASSMAPEVSNGVKGLYSGHDFPSWQRCRDTHGKKRPHQLSSGRILSASVWTFGFPNIVIWSPGTSCEVSSGACFRHRFALFKMASVMN